MSNTVTSSLNLPAGAGFGTEILIPLDMSSRSERAAALGGVLAKLVGANVTLTSVVRDPADFPLREAYLDQIGETVESLGGKTVKSKVVVGSRPARRLVQEVGSETSVVMSTGATVGPHDGHLGSVSEAMIRASTMPALLLGPRARPELSSGPDKVVVPVDGSASAERALMPAADLARVLRISLWVVTVLTPGMEQAAFDSEIVMESGYVRRLATNIRQNGVGAEFEVLHGRDPARAILLFAGNDAICAMSTTGRSGMSRLTMGSVTSDVVRHALLPTMVIPPAHVAQPDGAF